MLNRSSQKNPRYLLPLGAAIVALGASTSLRAQDAQTPALPTVAHTPVLSADGHSGGRNGDDRPALAYSPEDLDKIEHSFNLDFLKLDKAQVDERTRKVDGILLDYYKDGTLARMKQLIESTYGVRLYHLMNPVEAGTTTRFETLGLNPNEKKWSDQDRKKLNEAQKAYDAEVADLVRTDGIVRYYLGMSGGYFDHAPARSIPFRGVVAHEHRNEQGEIPFKQIAGTTRYCTAHHKDGSDRHGKPDCEDWGEFNGVWDEPFVFATQEFTVAKQFAIYRFRGTETASAVFTTTEDPMFEAPALRSFANAMNSTGLKALDATIVFMKDSLEQYTRDTGGNILAKHPTPYVVVYPQNDPTAPIPRPVVYIGADATDDDLIHMLNEHAPQIFAYNQMFNQHALPSLLQLDSELRKYSAELPEVAALVKRVNEENARSALQAVYLKVTYGLLSGVLAPAEFGLRAVAGFAGAPLAVGEMLSRPVFRQIFTRYTEEHFPEDKRQ